MVGVQLPKTAVKYIEVLVRKVVSYHIYVIFIAHLKKGVHEVRLLKISPRNFAVVIRVKHEENTHDHCVSISILKLGCRLQKF